MNFLLNFFYGVYALAQDIGLTLGGLIHIHYLYGFVFGIIIATLIYAIVLTRNPKPLCIALMRSRKETVPWNVSGFTCIDPALLRHFSTLREKILFILGLTVLMFLSFVLASLIFFPHSLTSLS